jgi:hypothetical protein
MPDRTLGELVVAFAASGIREGAAAGPALVCRLREASRTAMIARLGVGLVEQSAAWKMKVPRAGE